MQTCALTEDVKARNIRATNDLENISINDKERRARKIEAGSTRGRDCEELECESETGDEY
jgi:hypothetical protein